MRNTMVPCATCDERIIRVNEPIMLKCPFYKDRVPTAILKHEQECEHYHFQTALV